MNAAILAAVGASAGFGTATLLQSLGARRSAGGLRAFLHPLVLGGLALDGASSLLSLIAQARLPLFVVQTIIAAAVVVVVLAAPAVLHAERRARDVGAACVTVACLAVLAGASGPEHPARSDALLPALLAGAAALAVVSAALYRRGPAWSMAVCSGLGYAGAAVGVRAARLTGPLWSVVWQPAAAVIAVCGAVGILAYLRALESGSAGMVAAAGSVIEVAVPGLIGVLVLDDRARPGWGPAAGIACLVALAACVVLAFSPAATMTDVMETPATPGPSGADPGA
ncbi:hypothetical protein ACFQWG_10640 [Schaalia naturae]|uniref:Integral membrane protein n=3 Tax=Schaalia naturae TaxID=635203 RepID=A0ABW2SND2_9ACTO